MLASLHPPVCNAVWLQNAAPPGCPEPLQATGEMFLVLTLQQSGLYPEGDGSFVWFAFHLPSSTLRLLGSVLQSCLQQRQAWMEAPFQLPASLIAVLGLVGRLGVWFYSRNTFFFFFDVISISRFSCAAQ